MKGPNKTISLLASKKVTMLLFGLLAILLAVQTFLPSPKNALPLPTRITLLLLAINLATCTWQQRRRLPRDILLLHIGCLVIIAGNQLSATGYIATINIHEADSSHNAYRWDLAESTDLGFELALKKIHHQFYPTSVKIGVLHNGEKKKLIKSRTGSRFQFKSYSVEVVSLNPETKNLSLLISKPRGQAISYHTAQENNLPTDFPLDFQLVAYQNPVEQKVWVELELLQQGTIFAKGSTAVNSPFIHNGLRFYHTSTGRDRFGLPFAGIQIVKDPGISVVYLGFFITITGGLLLLGRKMHPQTERKKKPPTN